jgi:UTP:GlnB (protein PII) uridylyltransferase
MNTEICTLKKLFNKRISHLCVFVCLLVSFSHIHQIYQFDNYHNMTMSSHTIGNFNDQADLGKQRGIDCNLYYSILLSYM